MVFVKMMEHPWASATPVDTASANPTTLRYEKIALLLCILESPHALPGKDHLPQPSLVKSSTKIVGSFKRCIVSKYNKY
jgi:hypothetical protein